MKKKLTAIIINFLREPYLYKCLESLRTQYGYDFDILVGENGEYTKEKKKIIEKEFKAKYVKLPYDSGVCVGRNRLVEQVKTPYILVGDDDFYYTEESKVDKMVEFLQNNNDFDLIGGRIREGGVIKDYQGFIEDHGNYLHYKKLDLNDEKNFKIFNKTKFASVDLTFNFFVARTDKAKNVLWDERIKVCYEHSLFFIKFVRSGGKVAFANDYIVVHKPPVSGLKNKVEYKEFRSRKSDKKVFFEELGIDFAIDMNGRRDFYDRSETQDVDFLITTFKRPEFLKRLLLSISKYYPFARIVIADQNRKFIVNEYLDLYDECYKAGLQVKPTAYNIPYDCGVSYARNYLVNISKGDYKLILEDDFVFNEETNIKEMLETLKNNTSIDCVGGAVYENGIKVDFECDFDLSNFGTVRMKENKIDPDIVMNFALFKKHVFEKVKWDQELKNSEHIDFFLRFKDSGFKVKYLEDVKIGHDKKIEMMTEELSSYKELRKRKEFLKKMMIKNRINKIIYPNNFTIMLKNGEIIEGKNL